MEQLNDVNLDSNRKCAEVVSVKSPFEFWVRLEENKAEYESMLSELQEDYKHALQDKTYDLKGASLGLGCTFNQRLFEWHRCEIQSIVKSNAYVLFIDTGETDLVPLKCVKFLKDQYRAKNRFALKCSLCNIKPLENGASSWSPASSAALEAMVSNKTVSLVFKSRSSHFVYSVDMYIKNVNVADELVREGLAAGECDDADANSSSIGDNSHLLSTRALTNALRELEAHERFISRPKITASLVDEHEVLATHIVSPYCFYVQLGGADLAEFRAFEQEMQTFYHNALGQSKLMQLKEPQIGQMCVARYSEDGEWYRAIVKQVNEPERTCLVFFVDYGNEDTVPITDALLKLNDEFKSYPMFAIKCSLNGIRPPSADLDTSEVNAAIADFMYVTLEAKSFAKFVGRVSYSDCYLVELSFETSANQPRSDLALKLIKQGYAIKKPSRSDVQLNQTYETTVTHIYSPYYFFVQINDQVADFEAFAAEMQAYYAGQLAKMKEDASVEARVVIKKPRIGQLCVARYSDDELLYRAVVKEINGGAKSVRVFFIDYGNEDTVPVDREPAALFKIAEKFKDYPAMAYKCCLHGVQPLAEFKSDRVKQTEITDFMYLSIVSRAVVKFVSKSIDECYLVELGIEAAEESETTPRPPTKQLADFAEMLIERNYAIRLSLDPAEQRKKPQQMNGHSKPAVSGAKQQLPALANGAASGSGAGSGAIKCYKQPELALRVGEKYTFYVTHVETVKSFYIRLHDADSVAEMRRISSDLQYFYEKKINLSAPLLAANNACAYYDDEKKSWHRAKIVQVLDHDHCNIRLVDVGACKYVSRSALRELYDKYLEPACQAAWASLDDFASVPAENIDEKCHIKFKELAWNKPLYGRVVKDNSVGQSGDTSDRSSRQYLLNLFDVNGDSVYSSLTDDLDSTVSNDKFKPVVKSKLEETVVNDDSTMTNSFADQSLTTTAPPVVKQPPAPVVVSEIISKPPVVGKDTPDSARVAFVSRPQPTSHAAVVPDMRAQPRPVSRQPSVSFSDESSPFPKHDHTSVAKPASSVQPQPAASSAQQPAGTTMSIIKKFAPSQSAEPAPAFNPVFQPTQQKPSPLVNDHAVIAPSTSGLAKQPLSPPPNDRAIWQQANDIDIKRRMMVVNDASKTTCLVSNNVFDAVLANMDDGLKYLYFHLASTLPQLKRLEHELETDAKNVKDLSKIASFMELKFNTHYLVRYNSSPKLYRAKLLAPTQKLTLANIADAVFVVQLVDYGTRIKFGLTNKSSAGSGSGSVSSPPPTPTLASLAPTVDIEFYQITVRYMRAHAHALHCRLPLAHLIENTWNAEERAKFHEQIRVGQSYKIKILTPFEPYVFEFHNADKTINFQFDPIIARLTRNKLDPPTFITGTTHLVSHNELFAMSLGTRKFALEHFYVHSVDSVRMNELKFMVKYLDDSINLQLKASPGPAVAAAESALKMTTIKVGEVILGRPKNCSFLEQLTPALKSLIAGKWSRVEVKAIQALKADRKRLIRLLYLDYGVEDVITDQLQADMSYMNYGDYDLINMPVQFKIWPAFAYKCSLNMDAVKRKCAEAGRQNDFFDFKYFTEHLAKASEQLGNLRTFKVDFSANLVVTGSNNNNNSNNSTAEVFTVDLVDAKTEENLIDVLIKHSLAGIASSEFPSIVVYANSIDDFYVHKFDDESQSALLELQAAIQAKVHANEVKALRLVELGRICIAKFDDDGQWYRAKITGKPASGNAETRFDVQYIDYGNTSQVTLDMLREIPDEFVADQLPQSFAIRCQLSLSKEQAGDAGFRAELEEFFYEKLNDFKFYVKPLERLARAKNTDGNKFLVDLYESESRKLIQELLRQVGNSDETRRTEMEGQQENLSLSNEEEEDEYAIAEDQDQQQVSNHHDLTNDATALDATAGFNNTTNRFGLDTVDHSSRAQRAQLDILASEENTCQAQALVGGQKQSVVKATTAGELSWSETDPNLKNYDFVNDTYASSVNNYSRSSYQQTNTADFAQQQENDNSLLYDTANDDSTVFEKDVDGSAAGAGAFDQSSRFTLSEEPVGGARKGGGGRLSCNQQKQYSYRKNPDDTDEDEDDDDQAENEDSAQNDGARTATASAQIIISKSGGQAPQDDVAGIKNFIALEENSGECSNRIEDYIYQAAAKPKPKSAPRAIDYDQTCQSGHDEGENGCEHSESRASASVNNTTLDCTANHPHNRTVENFKRNSNWSANETTLDLSANHPKNMTVDNFKRNSDWSGNNTTLDSSADHPKNLSVGNFEENSTWDGKEQQAVVQEPGADESLSSSSNKNASVNGFQDASTWSDRVVKNPVSDDSGNQHENSTTLDAVDIDSSLAQRPDVNGSAAADQSSRWMMARTINEDSLSVWTNDGDVQEKPTRYETTLEGCYVIHVNSLDNFYVQAADADARLMEMKPAVDACGAERMKKMSAGAMCVAKYHVDEQLYRARILEYPASAASSSGGGGTRGRVKVHYIDYGNEDYVDPATDVFLITAKLREQPAQAIECQLWLSDELKALVETVSAESQAQLVNLFRDASALSAVSLKVRKVKANNVFAKDQPLPAIHAQTMITDLFIPAETAGLGEETNICDYMLAKFAKNFPAEYQQATKLKVTTKAAAVPSLLQPAVRRAENLKMPEAFEQQLAATLKSSQFDSVLINYEPLTDSKSDLIQLNLVNLDLLKLIDDLLDHVIATRPDTLLITGQPMMAEPQSNRCCYFVHLPDDLASLHKFKRRLARAKLVRRLDDGADNLQVQVQLVDFGVTIQVAESSVVEASPLFHTANAIPCALRKYSLDQVSADQLKTLSKSQLEHVNEIFKLLVNLSLTSLSVTVSSKLSAQVKNGQSDQQWSVRLADTKRGQLDVNHMMQACVSVMSQPFVGRLTGMESDLSQFDCSHAVSTSPKTFQEISKILKWSSYVRNVRAKVTENNSSAPQTVAAASVPQVGDFCLVDQSVEAIVSGPALVENSYVNTDSLVDANDFSITRGYIMEESNDSYLVFSVDSGKKLTVVKRRLIALDKVRPLIDLLDKSILLDKSPDTVVLAGSTNLVHLLPFMAMRCQLATPLSASNKDQVGELFKKSRFFNEKVKLRVVGSWMKSSRAPGADFTALYKFLQDEPALFKLVDLVDLPAETTPAVKSSSNSSSPSSAGLKVSEPVKRKCPENDVLMARKPAPVAEEKMLKSPPPPPPPQVQQHPFYFTLSYAKSLNCFYVHSNGAKKNLNMIEEMIQHEAARPESRSQSTTPQIGDIYGVFHEDEDAFYRVCLTWEDTTTTTSSTKKSSSFQAFYMDYGFTRNVRSDKLIPLSDAVLLQLAPQACCCKLAAAFEPHESSAGQFEQEIFHEFQTLLGKGKPFMVTIYSRFLQKRHIENYLPAQANNSRPIEVVVHLFKSDSVESNIEQHDRSYVDEYNQLMDETGMDSIDVAALLKRKLEDLRLNSTGHLNGSMLTTTTTTNTNGQQQSASRRTSTSRSAHAYDTESEQAPSSPLLKSPQKMFKPLTSRVREAEEVRVEIANIYSPNEIYLQLCDWEERLAKLNEMMAQDYGQDYPSLYNKTSNLYCLSESDLRANLPCALVIRSEASYYRARVISFKQRKRTTPNGAAAANAANANAKQVVVKLFLIDCGKTQTEPIELLYPLLDKYYEMPALSFECSLDFKLPTTHVHAEAAFHATRVLDAKSSTMGSFGMKIVEQILPITGLPQCESLVKYVVQLYGYPEASADGGGGDGGKKVNLLTFLTEFLLSVPIERVCNMSDAQLNEAVERFASSQAAAAAAAATRVPKIQINCSEESQEVEQQRRQHRYSADTSASPAMNRELADSSIAHHDKVFPFREHELPLGKALKIQLASVDTSKHFAITRLESIEARKQFLAELQSWHKENRNRLQPVFDESDTRGGGGGGEDGADCGDMSSYIGTPCVVKSTQLGGKWCRGFISLHPIGANFSYIYLVDYSKSVQVTNDRVYRLTHAAFLNEPATVNRCQLVDDVEQKSKFEKYQSLINVQSPAAATAAPSSRADENSSSMTNGDQSNNSSSSYISLDNIEIQIRCVEKRKTPLNQMTPIENNQYVVEIVDMKRIKRSFPQSPILKIQHQAPSATNGTPLYTKTVNNQFQQHLRQQQQQQQQQQLAVDDYDAAEESSRSLTIVETLTRTEREFDCKNNNLTNGSASYRKTTTIASSSKMTIGHHHHASINGSAIQGSSANNLTSPIIISDADHEMHSLVDKDCSSVCESTHINHGYGHEMSQSLGSDRTDPSMR